MTKLSFVGYSPILIAGLLLMWVSYPQHKNRQGKNNGTSTDASDHLETTEL
jgi:hypothetical protein